MLDAADNLPGILNLNLIHVASLVSRIGQQLFSERLVKDSNHA